MNENNRLSLRFYLWSIFLVILTSFAFDRFFSPDSAKFVSPVVFGQTGPANQTKKSPFAFLFGSKTFPIKANVLGFQTGAVSSGQPSVVRGSSSDPTSSSSTVSSSSSDSSSQTASTTPTPTPLVSNSSSSTTLTSSQQAVEDVSNLVVSLLVNGRYENLYNLMSLEFKNTFSLEDFVGSFTGSVKVVNGATTTAAKIYGASNDWAEQPVSLNLANGTTQKYLDIYHLENGSWTLFATEDQ